MPTTSRNVRTSRDKRSFDREKFKGAAKGLLTMPGVPDPQTAYASYQQYKGGDTTGAAKTWITGGILKGRDSSSGAPARSRRRPRTGRARPADAFKITGASEAGLRARFGGGGTNNGGTVTRGFDPLSKFQAVAGGGGGGGAAAPQNLIQRYTGLPLWQKVALGIGGWWLFKKLKK